MKQLIIENDENCVGCGLCMYACARRFGEAGIESSGILATSKSGFERGAKLIVCRACSDPPCASVCPTGALSPREQGGVEYDKNRCTGCENCIDACSIDAIFKKKNGKIAICIHCGYCENYCPHGVLSYKKIDISKLEARR